jgi:THO complex subunit 5
MTGIQEAILAQASQQTHKIKALADDLIGYIEKGENEDKLLEVQKEISTSLILLRSLHWDCQALINDYKEMATTSRHESDSFLLKMQNIYYQHRHLRSEIEQCEDLESKHESIDMVPEDQFVAENPQFRDLDSHQLILERIKDEERRRLELFVIKTKLQETKTEVSNQVKAIRSDIEDSDALNSELRRLSESAVGLKSYFDRH